MNLLGRRTMEYQKYIAVASAASMAGQKEAEGNFGKYYDEILEDDLLGQKSWEMAESEMLRRTVVLCAEKAGMEPADIGALLAGDLNAQIISSGFAARALGIPFFGMYGACSTFVEGMIVAGALIDGGAFDNAVCAASSHFCTAERQFRSPLELGTQRPPSAQWTATAAGAVLLKRGRDNQPLLTHGTVGRVIDLKIKDANHMGAAMAPAVADTIDGHLEDSGRSFRDYDLIVTGDLGEYGLQLVKKLLKERRSDFGDAKFMDCGKEIYTAEQDAHAGGSGCGCIASVYSAYIQKELQDGTLKRILLVGSGAMLSLASTQQGESIPCVSYAAAIEGRY